MILTEHPCNWCGSNNYLNIVNGPDLLMGLPGKFSFVQCSQCGLLRQNPRLTWENLKDYYPEGYSSHTKQVNDLPSRIDRIDKRYGLWKRVKFVSKFKSTGNWLDIGCGTGRILQEAQIWNNWTLFGLEPVTSAATYAKQKLNIPIFNLTLEEYQGEENSYDVITMWDVLEHLPTPINDLKKVQCLLKPGGILILSMPNMLSIGRKLFRQFWIGYDLPRHLYLFPPDLLKKIFEDIGMKVITQKCIAGNHGAFMLNLSFWNKSRNSIILEHVISKGADFWLYRLFTLIPMFILDKLKMSNNITYVITKK